MSYNQHWIQYVEAPEQFGLHCRVTDSVVLHQKIGGYMRCSGCGRHVPASQIVSWYAVDEDYHKGYRLQVPEALRKENLEHSTQGD